MKNVDIELIVAFIDKTLDQQSMQEVRDIINNSPEWYLAYVDLMNTKKILNEPVLQSSKVNQRVDNAHKSSNFIPKFISNIKIHTFKYASIYAPLLFLMIVLTIFSNSGSSSSGFSSSYRSLHEDLFAKVDFDKNSLVIKSKSQDDLYCSILVSNLSRELVFSDLRFDSFVEIVDSNEEKYISIQEVISYYKLENLDKIRVIIFNQMDSVIYDEIIKIN